MAFNLGDIFVTFKAKAEGFNQAVQGVRDAGEKVKGVTEKIGKFGESAEAAGKSMSTKLTLPILAAGGAALKMSTDFNGAMANIATLIPGSTDRVNELKTSIQDMAIQTGKSTADLADGMYQVISAFGDTAESAKILEINAKGAKAGLAETTDAINLTSAVTKGYGDTTAAAVQKASDLALMTVRLGQTTFPELAASVGRVTPLAAALNVTQEELFGTMATFTGVTGGAAEVSTQLRGVLQALMAPTADMQDLMKKLGYENGQAMIKQLGLQGSIEAMTKAASDTGKPLQAFIGSIEGQTLAMAATGGQADVFKEKIAAMGDVAGVTDEAFNEVANGVNKAGFQMEQAKAKAEVAGQKMGDALAPALIKVSEAISKVADWFMKLSPRGQKIVLVVAGIVAAIGPLLIIIGKLAMGIRAVGAAFTFLSMHPAVLIIGAIILLIAGLAFLIIKNWDTLKQWFSTFWEWIKNIFASAFNWIKDNWQLLMIILLGPIGALVAAIITYWDQIKAGAQAAWDWIKNAVMTVINWIIAYFQFWLAMYVAVLTAIKNAAVSVWNWITGFIGRVIQGWINIISTIVGVVRNVFQGAMNIVSSIWSGLGNVIRGAIDGMKGAFGRVTDIVSGPFKAAFNAIARLWNNSIGKLSFQAPDWVPGLGGKGFSMPKLPELAEGGIVSKATVAMIGEGREPEAVIPLSKIGQVAADMGHGNQGNTFNLHFDGIMARSKSELRDIMIEGIEAVDQRLIAQGKKPILGGS